MAATRLRKRKASGPEDRDHHIIPHLHMTESGRVHSLEQFPHYVARQIGFSDANEVPQLCRLANEYLKKSKGSEERLYKYFENETNADSLYVKLVDEFERCVLSYFAFHWSQSSHMISQVFAADSPHKTKLKELVLAATRKLRFEHITKELKMTRVFSTLVKEMRTIQSDSPRKVMKQTDAYNGRSPVLLLMGGGMGAGKSTALKEIVHDYFGSEAESTAIVVEADDFKETDVIYQALNSKGHYDDMLHTAELVHQSSTDAASSLLVAALNEGRDVIMDGTFSWEPFVEQTIEMARNVHRCMYRMGVGYKVAKDGNVIENYWDQVNEEEEHELNIAKKNPLPYRIELVGVVCDGYLAVVRGIRRAIMTGRAVRVNSQLASHRRFAAAFPRYCELVDHARLYSTNNEETPPKTELVGVAWKSKGKSLTMEPEGIKLLTTICNMNEEAECIYELYDEYHASPLSQSGSVWNDIVLSPTRCSNKKELRECITKIEGFSIEQ